MEKYCNVCGQSRRYDVQNDVIENGEGVIAHLVSYKCKTCKNYIETEHFPVTWFVIVVRRKHGWDLEDERYGPYETWGEAFERAKVIPEPHVLIEKRRVDG